MFLRDVAAAASGTIGAQLLNVLSAPILTRLYEPEDFGALALFGAVLGITIVAASLRYEAAIPLPEDDESAWRLVVLCFGLLIASATLMSLLIVSFGGGLLEVLGARIPQGYLLLLPISFLGLGSHQILSSWAVREKAFWGIARGRLTQTASQLLTQVGLGMVYPGPIGLLVGEAVGRVSGGVAIAATFRKEPRRFSPPSFSGMVAVAKRYAKFPLLTVGASLLSAASTQIPYVLIATFFGTGAVGAYALALRLLALPAALLDQAVAQVYTSSAHDLRQENERLAYLTERLSISLFALGLPAFMTIAAAGPELFTGIFGDTWRPAGRYAQILAPWFLLSLVAGPLSVILVVREQQAHMVAFAAIALGMRSLSVYVGASAGSEVVAVTLLAASGVVINLVSIAWFLRAAHTSASRIVIPCLRLVLSVLPLSLLLVAVTFSTNLLIIYLVAALVIAGNYLIVIRAVPELRQLLPAMVSGGAR